MVSISLDLCCPKKVWISCTNFVEAIVQFAGKIVDEKMQTAIGIDCIVAFRPFTEKGTRSPATYRLKDKNFLRIRETCFGSALCFRPSIKV